MCLGLQRCVYTTSRMENSVHVRGNMQYESLLGAVGVYGELVAPAKLIEAKFEFLCVVANRATWARWGLEYFVETKHGNTNPGNKEGTKENKQKRLQCL